MQDKEAIYKEIFQLLDEQRRVLQHAAHLTADAARNYAHRTDLIRELVEQLQKPAHPSPAKPSPAQPSQAKPSQAKPSQAS